MLNLRAVTVFAIFPAIAGAQATPGTVNYIEGAVEVNGNTMTTGSAGTVSIQPGQSVQVDRGRAEVLLTPGVYVRVGDNSVLKLDSLSATAVRVELVRGEAVVEVDRVDKSVRLDFVDSIADAYLDHSGVFLFKADTPAVDVYVGRVRVEDDRKGIDVKQGEELVIGDRERKPRKFDTATTDPLYGWGLERADFASQTSEWTGAALLGLDGQSQFSDGWYWNPWYKSWAFIPEKGYVVTPLRYGLYAPHTPHYSEPVFGDFRE